MYGRVYSANFPVVSRDLFKINLEKETIKICSSKKYDHSELNHTQDKASLMANISTLMGNYLKKPLPVFSEISY